MSARLLAITWRKTTYPILNKREIPASGKFTKYSRCSLLAICIFLKTLVISVFSKVLTARKKNLSTARALKNKHTARMLANARKDHSIPLMLSVKLRKCQAIKILTKPNVWDILLLDFSKHNYFNFHLNRITVNGNPYLIGKFSLAVFYLVSPDPLNNHCLRKYLYIAACFSSVSISII